MKLHHYTSVLQISFCFTVNGSSFILAKWRERGKITRLHSDDFSLLLSVLFFYTYDITGRQTCIPSVLLMLACLDCINISVQICTKQKYSSCVSMLVLVKHPKNIRFSHVHTVGKYSPPLFYILHDALQSFFTAPFKSAYLLRKCWQCWCSRNHFVSSCTLTGCVYAPLGVCVHIQNFQGFVWV